MSFKRRVLRRLVSSPEEEFDKASIQWPWPKYVVCIHKSWDDNGLYWLEVYRTRRRGAKDSTPTT